MKGELDYVMLCLDFIIMSFVLGVPHIPSAGASLRGIFFVTRLIFV